MASWSEFERAAPELAARVRARFEAHGLGLLATLRADGSPRISGIEPLVWEGELWLGSMPGSRKGADLLRDPRFALHSATVDTKVSEGDAKVSGRAVPVDDPETKAGMLRAHHGADPDAIEPDFLLVRADLTSASFVRVEGDELVTDLWIEGRAPRQHRRK
jgi:nitroimidazol reductase NimA-like FMN-containing flavoprotein (pyridoxamine 5'-phosphate oxidase superfamily)